MNSSSQHTPTPWVAIDDGQSWPHVHAEFVPHGAICNLADFDPEFEGDGNRARERAKANAAFIVLACNSFESLRQENARVHESYEGMNAAHQQLNDEHAKLLASHATVVKALKYAREKIEEEWGCAVMRELAMIDAALNSTKPSQ